MKFTKSVQTSDLQLFGSLEEAQRHELTLLFLEKPSNVDEIASTILQESEKVIDILTTTSRSRPGRRKINKKPKLKEVEV